VGSTAAHVLLDAEPEIARRADHKIKRSSREHERLAVHTTSSPSGPRARAAKAFPVGDVPHGHDVVHADREQ
jgi:hypothetical protein